MKKTRRVIVKVGVQTNRNMTCERERSMEFSKKASKKAKIDLRILTTSLPLVSLDLDLIHLEE